FGFDARGDVFIIFQELADVFASLAYALALVAEPGAGFLHDVAVHGQIHQVALTGDALAVHDVEFGFPERCRGLVLDDFDLGAVADHLIAVFDGGNAADIDAHRGVKLERAATGGGLRIPKHHADLFANLVDEDQTGTRLGDNAGQLAQRLRHQPGLQSHVAVAHFTFQFGFRD